MIKIDVAILDAIDESSEYYINKYPWLYKLAEKAYNNIKSPYQYIPEIIVLDVVSSRIVTLPDRIAFILAWLPDDHGTDCWDLFASSYGKGCVDLAYQASQAHWIGTESLPVNMMNNDIDYSMIGKDLMFNRKMTFTKVTVLAKVKPSLDGSLLIPEELVAPISKFITNKIQEVEFRDALRRNRQTNNYSYQNQMAADNREYNRLVMKARGELNGKQTSEIEALSAYFGGN